LDGEVLAAAEKAAALLADSLENMEKGGKVHG